MTKTTVQLLAKAVRELEEHNQESRYRTAKAVIAEMRDAVEKEVPGFDWSTFGPCGWTRRD